MLTNKKVNYIVSPSFIGISEPRWGITVGLRPTADCKSAINLPSECKFEGTPTSRLTLFNETLEVI